MSDEIKAAGCGCYEPCDDNNWLIWIIVIIVLFCCFCGDNIFGRRGCY